MHFLLTDSQESSNEKLSGHSSARERESVSSVASYAPMRRARLSALLLAAAALAVSTGASGPPPSASRPDPLADDISRWSRYLNENPSKDEDWTEIKAATAPVLGKAEEAMNDGRWYLALQRLAPARANLAAQVYMDEIPAKTRTDMAAFEAEWASLGKTLSKDLGTPSPQALAGVTPAAVRAVGEAALPQVRVFYDASLDYGHNTMADAGFFYLASARAQKDFVEFCRSLSRPASLSASAAHGVHEPALRSIAGEIDALEGDLLTLYRPPASIERHKEFIVASSTLKEARELDGWGLRYGALLRYLQAAMRIDALRTPAPDLAAPALGARLAELQGKMDAGGRDDSIGRIFLESAQGDVAHAEAGKKPEVAAAVATDVLPRYFAALEPPKPRPAKPPAAVTVTLVRWPYT